jgi:4-amino-4-deoxy-L-arabinose transferase-like glycosyltransferase
MHATMALLVTLAVYSAMRPRGKAVASAGAVLVGTSPWLLLLGGVAYNEAGLLLFATLSIVFAMRAFAEDGTRGEMVLAGLFAGLACGTKLTAVPTVLLAVPVAMAISRLVSRRDTPRSVEAQPRRRLIGDILAFLLAAVLVLSPWLVRNVAWTGNPVFPELTALFGRAHFTPEQVDRWRAAHAPRDDQRTIPARIEALLKHGTLDWRSGHVLGGLIVVGIVVGFARRTRESVMLATMLLLLLAFWLGLTHLQGRFLVLGLPLAALLLGALPTGWSYASVLVACASLALGIVHAGPQLARSAGVLGLSDLTPLLKASLPDERLVDRLVNSDRQVALVGDARAFFYPIPMSRLRYRTVFDVSGDDLLHGYHVDESDNMIVLVDPSELRRFFDTYRHFPILPRDWLMRREPFALRP